MIATPIPRPPQVWASMKVMNINLFVEGVQFEVTVQVNTHYGTAQPIEILWAARIVDAKEIELDPDDKCLELIKEILDEMDL